MQIIYTLRFECLKPVHHSVLFLKLEAPSQTVWAWRRREARGGRELVVKSMDQSIIHQGLLISSLTGMTSVSSLLTTRSCSTKLTG